MTKTDDIKAKMPCSLYKIFCITNHINCVENVEPWYGQIKKLADGADKWAYGLHRAVIYGMYPELEDASKEFYCRFKDICSEFEKRPNQDEKRLIESVKSLSVQIGKQYGLNENRYLFNEMTEEQAKRVQKRKDIERKIYYNEIAEAMTDPLHIIMQGLCEKLSPDDCKKLVGHFYNADKYLEWDKDNNLEYLNLCQKKCSEAYSIYKQVKKCLEKAEIKDGLQIIDADNYAGFVQTLGNFKYNGKEYNLLDTVKPITQKRNLMGVITETRPNATSSIQQTQCTYE